MNKTALITGGSSGLGLALATRLRAQGYHLILLARNAHKLQDAKIQLQKMPGSGEIRVYCCDVADEQSLQKTFDTVRIENGGIDFLIMCAAIASVELFKDYRCISDMNQNLKVNLLGVVNTTYLAMRMLTTDAHILYVSSGFGLVGPAGYSLYATAKAGIINFAEAIRRETLQQRIHVHVTCPGDILTPMYEGEYRDMPQWMKAQLKRGKPMSAENVAACVLKQCQLGRFMIVPSADVKLLIFVLKYLPRFISTWIIDKALPLPPKTIPLI